MRHIVARQIVAPYSCSRAGATQKKNIPFACSLARSLARPLPPSSRSPRKKEVV